MRAWLGLSNNQKLAAVVTKITTICYFNNFRAFLNYLIYSHKSQEILDKIKVNIFLIWHENEYLFTFLRVSDKTMRVIDVFLICNFGHFLGKTNLLQLIHEYTYTVVTLVQATNLITIKKGDNLITNEIQCNVMNTCLSRMWQWAFINRNNDWEKPICFNVSEALIKKSKITCHLATLKRHKVNVKNIPFFYLLTKAVHLRNFLTFWLSQKSKVVDFWQLKIYRKLCLFPGIKNVKNMPKISKIDAYCSGIFENWQFLSKIDSYFWDFWHLPIIPVYFQHF